MDNKIIASLVWMVLFAGCAMDTPEDVEIGREVSPFTSRWQDGMMAQIVTSAGKCLDVPSGSREAGVGINQYRCHGGPNQVWQFEYHSYYDRGESWGRYINLASGLCLEVDVTADGIPTRLRQNHCSNTRPQFFRWDPDDGTIHVTRDMCLDVPSGSSADGVGINTYPCHGGPAQQFGFRQDGSWTLNVHDLTLRELNEDGDEPVYHVLTHHIKLCRRASWSDADARLFEWGSRESERHVSIRIDQSLDFHGVRFGDGGCGTSVLAVATIAVEADRCSRWERRYAALRGHDALHSALNREFGNVWGMRLIEYSPYDDLHLVEGEIALEIKREYQNILNCSAWDSDDVINVQVQLVAANTENVGLRVSWNRNELQETWMGTTLTDGDAVYHSYLDLEFTP